MEGDSAEHYYVVLKAIHFGRQDSTPHSGTVLQGSAFVATGMEHGAVPMPPTEKVCRVSGAAPVVSAELLHVGMCTAVPALSSAPSAETPPLCCRCVYCLS